MIYKIKLLLIFHWRWKDVCGFKELGATVESYDLDDKDNDYIDHSHKFADMNERLPIKDNYADIVLCQEGIEHLQDQFFIISIQ